MSKIKKPSSPTEVPNPDKDPEVRPDKPSRDPAAPEKEPEIIPEVEPEEPAGPTPAEIPPPAKEA